MEPRRSRVPVEGDFVETIEGLIFDVKGLVHPPDAVIAYVRYVPCARGTRKRGGTGYRKLYSLEEREKFLRMRYPEYIRFDPVFGTTVQAVPRGRIAVHYDPYVKLKDMMLSEDLDPVEEAAVELARLMMEEAGLGPGSVGVTGSILVGLHTDSSDIDLVVRGERNAKRAYAALLSLREKGLIEPHDDQTIRRLYRFRSEDTPLPFEVFTKMESRKVLQGIFRGREFYVRLIKEREECGERYGDRVYVPLGTQRIRAEVVDAEDSIFTPCKYIVSNVEVLEGPRQTTVREVVSLRGRFCELAREGERIVARGKLELVRCRDGSIHYRLLLGRRGDYMYTVG